MSIKFFKLHLTIIFLNAHKSSNQLRIQIGHRGTADIIKICEFQSLRKEMKQRKTDSLLFIVKLIRYMQMSQIN